MSHYNVNAGVPKTLIQHLIRWSISSGDFESRVGEVLQSVLETEITPELVPVGDEDEKGRVQSSEATVGPFALQDFSLFHVLRYGFRPSRIAFLAWHAWSDSGRGTWPPGFPEDKRPGYSLAEIRHWLEVFVQRFYSFSQFKRSALPNGPKVSNGGSLSPRGDWRAPSDMSARIWLAEIEREVPEG
jgi:NAD+ synthase (glutamine-hydrolysing)